jgi:hypothetical protein
MTYLIIWEVFCFQRLAKAFIGADSGKLKMRRLPPTDSPSLLGFSGLAFLRRTLSHHFDCPAEGPTFSFCLIPRLPTLPSIYPNVNSCEAHQYSVASFPQQCVTRGTDDAKTFFVIFIHDLSKSLNPKPVFLLSRYSANQNDYLCGLSCRLLP